MDGTRRQQTTQRTDAALEHNNACAGEDGRPAGWMPYWMDGNWKDNPNCIVITASACVLVGYCGQVMPKDPSSADSDTRQSAGNTQRHNSYNYGLGMGIMERKWSLQSSRGNHEVSDYRALSQHQPTPEPKRGRCGARQDLDSCQIWLITWVKALKTAITLLYSSPRA